MMRLKRRGRRAVIAALVVGAVALGMWWLGSDEGPFRLKAERWRTERLFP